MPGEAISKYLYIYINLCTVQGVTEVEEVRAVAGRRYSKLWGVDLHEGTWRMTDSGSGATLDKVRRWVQGQW